MIALKKEILWKQSIGVLLTGVLILTGVIPAIPAKAASESIGVTYRTQNEIQERMARDKAVVDNDALTFAVEPVTSGNYVAGKLSDESLSSGLALLNQIRYIAGIPDNVTLNDEYNQYTQAAALTNYVQGQLTHYPSNAGGMDEALFQLGATGAGSSNIAWASWQNRSFNESILSWLDDSDAFNIDRLGHRRWILNPTMGSTGFGAVTGQKGTYSALYAFDRNNSAGANITGVVWPAQNMPIDYFDIGQAWSLSMGRTVDAAAVNVTLTRISDGKTWSFSQTSADGNFYVDNGGYGQRGCIIFRPNNIDSYKAGDVFQVKVTGLGEDVSYTVSFFDPSAVSTEKPVSEINLNYTKLTLEIQQTETLIASVLPEDATNKTITWSSSDPSVASVENGKVTAVKQGTATITAASVYGKTAVCVVTVTKPVNQVSLNYKQITLGIQQTEDLIVSVLPEDATDKTITWSSSDSLVATVKNGKVTGVKEGTATITAASVNGKTAVCKVIVVTPEELLNRKLADVFEGSWQYEPALYVYEKGIMTGKGVDNKGLAIFAPNDMLTREQFAQILYSAEGKPSVVYLKRFEDVKENQWYTNAVIWAAEQGIVSGYGNGMFGVGDNITREQLALMLYKYAEIKEYNITDRAALDKFTDAFAASDWAKEQLQWAVANEIMSGKGEKLDPAGNATRAECAAMLRKFFIKFQSEVSQVIERIEFQSGYINSYEYAIISAYNQNKEVVWEYKTPQYEVTELNRTSKIGQKGDKYYFVQDGSVVALDVQTGKVVWVNNDFGGAGTYALFGENAIYLCGYYGPDFYAVSYDGKTLAEILQFDKNYWWAYQIKLVGNQAAVYLEGSQVLGDNDKIFYVDLDTYEVKTELSISDEL